MTRSVTTMVTFDAAPFPADKPSVAAKAVADRLRIEAIEEAADLAIPFVVGLRQAARDGDVDRIGDCLRALWLAAVTMRQAYREIGGDA